MKKLTIVFLLLGLLVLLAVFRLTDRNGYKNEPEALLIRLQQGGYMIAPEKADQSFLVINLGNAGFPEGLTSANRMVLPFSDFQNKENLELFLKPGQKIALVSDNIATSVKAFTFLHQQGVENLYIVNSTGKSNDVLNYKFVPEPISSD